MDKQNNNQKNVPNAPGGDNQAGVGASADPTGSGGQRPPVNDNDPVTILEKVQIVNGEHIIKTYKRGPLLGKGGFAKCYQITLLETQKIMAAKIIPKNTLIKNRARQKLVSEIKIHKSLHHTNVVKFEHVFEDHDNVYILLELCPHQTLNELIKRRKRITELETKCYIVQIVQALQYLHANRVIHRDLKLGNLFLGDSLEIKLGDFGLATKLEFDGEKKRTICGTPNYIAPEILDGRIGHSYEVDVWSLGVILYTLLIGKPPFETAEVKTTYKRIKANQYSFPDHTPIPPSAKALIQLILQQDPAARPTLEQILAHPFINNGGTIPKLLPLYTLQGPPEQSYIKQYEPSALNLKAKEDKINTEVFTGRNPGKNQPPSNIMKPVEYPNNNYPNDKKPDQTNPQQIMSSANLQAQKNQPTQNPFGGQPNYQQQNKADNRPNSSGLIAQQSQQQFNQNIDMGRTGGMSKDFQSVQQLQGAGAAMTLQQQQQQQSQQQLMKQSSSQLPPQTPTIDGSKNCLWVTQYVDYSTKYGLGYLLSNGQSGVVFNDTTKIILDTEGTYFEYIYKRETEEITVKHEMSNFPLDLQKKVTLLQHFRTYLLTEQAKKILSPNQNQKKTDYKYQQKAGQPLPYLKKWMQTKHAIMFRLSNKIVQVQFSDKTEILLNSQDKIVSFMNKKGERSHYPLSEAMSSTNTDMTKRLKYTKEILTTLLKNNPRNPNPDAAPINIDQNDNPSGGNNNGGNTNFKFGMTTTMENEFPKMNPGMTQDPFTQSQQKMKGMASQKSLSDKEQMQYIPQNSGGNKTPQGIKPNQGYNNPPTYIQQPVGNMGQDPQLIQQQQQQQQQQQMLMQQQQSQSQQQLLQQQQTRKK